MRNKFTERTLALMTEQTTNTEIAIVGQISSPCIMHANESILQGGSFGPGF